MPRRSPTAVVCFVAGFMIVAGCLATVDESKIGQVGVPPTADSSPVPETSTSDSQADAPSTPRSGMACGDSGACTAPEQWCCINAVETVDPKTGTCLLTSADNCTTGDFFRCMGELDCQDARICCATRENGFQSACKPTCAGTEIILCDSANACPDGMRCLKSGEVPGLFTCQ